jgi:hypothetical protein
VAVRALVLCFRHVLLPCAVMPRNAAAAGLLPALSVEAPMAWRPGPCRGPSLPGFTRGATQITASGCLRRRRRARLAGNRDQVGHRRHGDIGHAPDKGRVDHDAVGCVELRTGGRCRVLSVGASGMRAISSILPVVQLRKRTSQAGPPSLASMRWWRRFSVHTRSHGHAGPREARRAWPGRRPPIPWR